MPETIRVLAGDCTTVYDDGTERQEHRGRVLVVVKPDGTVLVHDATGYQPVAWLTRAEGVSCRGEFAVTASDGDQRLHVAVHDEDGFARLPVSPAGIPVGDCQDCDGPLVRTNGRVTCPDCGERYGLPRGATVRGERCSCGLPRIRVERGTPLDVCLDRQCEPLSEAVADEFDRAWDCPDCGEDLEIHRNGGLRAECTDEDCGAGFAIPRGTVVDQCDCGLPTFEMPSGRRCLDAACERDGAAA